jgi:DNA-binding MltR family transcriptional regulator
MTKRTIIAVERLSSDSKSLYNLLNRESGLSVVLVGVGFLDACLASLLERFFLKTSVAAKLLDGTKGALGSFASRSDTCYCLGLIEKSLYQDLFILAEIRNLYAHHHLALNFAVTEVAQKCTELMYIARLKNGDAEEPLLAQKYFAHPRNRFVLSVVMISSRLMLTALGAKRVK